MAELMDVLLADGQRLQERRIAPPPNMPATRADKIIAEGDRKRLAYRALNLAADTAMVYGAQVGYLHAQVRILCNEVEALNIKRDPALQYVEVVCDVLNADVWVGCTYTAGESARTYGPPEDCHEGSPEELEVCEVWVNGAEVSAGLKDAALDQISDAALQKVHRLQAEAREADEAGADDARRAWA